MYERIQGVSWIILGWDMVLRGWFAFAVIFMVSSHANATSLKEAVRVAVKTNPRIAAAQANLRATGYVLDQAKGRLFPEIDLSADVGRQRIDRPNGLGPDVNDRPRTRRQITVNFRQVLFDGFDRANDIYRSQARISAAASRILVRSDAVALSAIEAYVDIRRHENLLHLARENVKRHRILLQLIKSRLDGGRAPLSDQEQTVERLEAAKALVSQVDVALGSAVAKYKNIVGRKPVKLHSLRYAKGIPKSSQAVVNVALRNNPQLQSIVADIDVADFDREQFRSTLYPQLFLEGSASRGENLEGTPGRNDELKASVVLRWKLFDGGQRKNRDLELAERASQKRIEQQILARDITRDIETAWARLTRGREEVSSLGKQVEQNRRLVSSYKNEYEADKRSLLDVLDAESSKFASEFEFQNARALHIFSSYQLLGSMGTLLDYFGIAKPDGADRPVKVQQGLSAVRFNKKKLIIPALR